MMGNHTTATAYRGRIAPTPTGDLHSGHGRTFWVAWHRARTASPTGALVYREEDLDPQRCKPHFAANAIEDLRWLGIDWDAGSAEPAPGEPPARQSERLRAGIYHRAWERLRDSGRIYPCTKSRKDLARAALAPHAEDEAAEPIYPPAWRPPPGVGRDHHEPGETNWRFRVPDGKTLAFEDGLQGAQAFRAGVDFGDFLVWRRDDVPSYELAVVVDDHAMGITEVVRGEDLLLSTARQLLLYRALDAEAPAFFHCPLMRDAAGKRLAKRHRSLSLRELRAGGTSPDSLVAGYAADYAGWLRG